MPKMHLRLFLIFNLVVCLLVFQVKAESPIETKNATDIQKEAIERREVMVRKLHRNQDQKKGMMHIVIHKVQSGDPYLKVFDGDKDAARAFTNKIWNRLLNRYSTMKI